VIGAAVLTAKASSWPPRICPTASAERRPGELRAPAHRLGDRLRRAFERYVHRVDAGRHAEFFGADVGGAAHPGGGVVELAGLRFRHRHQIPDGLDSERGRDDEHACWPASGATPLKSLSVSYGRLEYRTGFTTCPVDTTPSVYPSGGDFASTPMPIVPPAPGRFSTSTG
jgi:hypothetical protein